MYRQWREYVTPRFNHRLPLKQRSFCRQLLSISRRWVLEEHSRDMEMIMLSLISTTKRWHPPSINGSLGRSRRECTDRQRQSRLPRQRDPHHRCKSLLSLPTAAALLWVPSTPRLDHFLRSIVRQALHLRAITVLHRLTGSTITLLHRLVVPRSPTRRLPASCTMHIASQQHRKQRRLAAPQMILSLIHHSLQDRCRCHLHLQQDLLIGRE